MLVSSGQPSCILWLIFILEYHQDLMLVPTKKGICVLYNGLLEQFTTIVKSKYMIKIVLG